MTNTMTHRQSFLAAALMLTIALPAIAAETNPDPAAIATAVPAPLYRDPIYDGAADPVVVWNAPRQVWSMFYTQRRARLNLPGVEWGHGTEIGVAESRDEGMTWVYKGTLALERPGTASRESKGTVPFSLGRKSGQSPAKLGQSPDPDCSFWAPDCIRDDSGVYHLFATFVPGLASSHRDFGGERHIVHYSSADLSHWTFEGRVPTSSDYCIDPTLCRRADGQWWMWFKDEAHDSETRVVASRDLRQWKPVPDPGVSKLYGEGPKVFRYQGHYWMIKDPNRGLDVYRSEDLEHWTYQGKILDKSGWRNDDATVGKHCDVVVCGPRAYVFYLVEPGMMIVPAGKDGVQPLPGRRSAIQAAELEIKDGRLTCDRNKLIRIRLTPPEDSKGESNAETRRTRKE
jgi:hypothetical protein